MTESEHKRSRQEIMAEILKTAENGACEWRLVSKANSNSRHIKGFLKDAVDRGLLEIRNIGKRRMFFVTDRGRQFVAHLTQIELILGVSYGSS